MSYEAMFKELSSLDMLEDDDELPILEEANTLVPLGHLHLRSENRGLSRATLSFGNLSNTEVNITSVNIDKSLKSILSFRGLRWPKVVSPNTVGELLVWIYNIMPDGLYQGNLEVNHSCGSLILPLDCTLLPCTMSWDIWPHFLIYTGKQLLDHIEQSCFNLRICSLSETSLSFDICLEFKGKKEVKETLVVKPFAVEVLPLSFLLSSRILGKREPCTILIESTSIEDEECNQNESPTRIQLFYI